MKRLGIVVGVLVLMAFAFPVLAQGMFADVPTDHWAYPAVNALQQKGILIGYPDGTFGGKRAMTRYEFAMAINRLWEEVQKLGGGAGPAGPAGATGEAGPAGPPGVTPEELNQIKRLAQEFKDELAALGVDVDQLKKDVSALKDRVAAIEKEMERVRVTFEGNMIAQGTMVKRGDAAKNPFDIDGRPMAVKSSPNNLLNSAPVLWDYDLTIKGKVAEHTRATVVINASTYLPAVGNISRVAGAGGGNNPPGNNNGTDYDYPRLVGQGGSQATTITPWYYYIETGANLSFLGENAITIGKFPLQLTPYTFKLVDTDYYTYLPKTDSGDFPVTGIKTNFTAGPVGVMLFAVQHLRSAFVDAPGTAIGTSNAIGSRPWDQSAGARLSWSAFGAGKLGLTYIQAGLSNIRFAELAAGRSLNKAEIYGVDFNSKFMDDRLGVYAEWTKSDYKQGSRAVGITNTDGRVRASNKNNSAFDAMLTYNLGGLVIGGGYRDIEPNFYAPGYWLRIGPAKNPVNIKGGRGTLGYKFSEALDVNASYEDLQESKKSAMNAKVKRATAGVNYKLYEGSFVLLGYENVQLKQSVGAANRTTNEASYFDLGYGRTFSDNLSLRLYYQYVDWKDKIGAGSYKGNVAGTQLTVKF